MNDKWGSVAVACDEGDPEGCRPQTAKEARELWENTARTIPTEAERMRHCCGCVWLKTCGSNLCCSHILDTDKKRPCPPGPGCTAKRTPPGWKYPAGYAAWCAEIDRKRGKTIKPRSKQPDFQRIYARELHDRHVHTDDIAAIVGLSSVTIRGLIARENWKGAGKWRVLKRMDGFTVMIERERYQEAKAKWDAEHGIKDSNDDERNKEK